MQICYRTVVIYRSSFKTEKKGKIIEFKIEGNYKREKTKKRVLRD